MNKKILVTGILVIVMLVATSFASALNESNEQSAEKNVVNDVYNDTKSLSLGTATVHVRVFGWHPEIGGDPYSLKGASVYIKVIGIIPRIILGKNLVGSGYTDGAGKCCIDMPTPMNSYWYYLVSAKMSGYKPCYAYNWGAMSFQIIKLKANDNPDEIWLTLLGKVSSDAQTQLE
jgi:hypothetical protein